MKRASLIVLLIVDVGSLFEQSPTTRVVSPEVTADHRVTLRFRAPKAKEVDLNLEGTPKPIPMQGDDQGLWSITTEPLAPDFYGYSFIADGVRLIDPSNSLPRPNLLLLSTTSEVHVPGPESLTWEPGACPMVKSIITFIGPQSLVMRGISSFTLRLNPTVH